MSETGAQPGFETISAQTWSDAAGDLSALEQRLRPPQTEVTRLYAGGDVGSSARFRRTERRRGHDYLLQDVSPVLQQGDIVFANLETPLLPQAPDGALHTGEQAFAQTLARSGFTTLSLANNHIYDHGPEGLASSLQAVREAGMNVIGADQERAAAAALQRIDVDGLTIGWLAAARTLQTQVEGGPHFEEFDADRLVAAVAKTQEAKALNARNQGKLDVLVVSLHLGYMYIDYPHADHRRLTHRLAEAGADLILVHHAHVLQGVEVVVRASPSNASGPPRHCVICHNMGNLLFDWQDGHVQVDVAQREQREGAIFAFDLDRFGITRFAVLPTLMAEDDGQLQWARENDGERILQRMRNLSQQLQDAPLDHPMLKEAFERQFAQRNTRNAMRVLLHHLRRGHWSVVLSELKNVRPRHARQLVRWIWNRGSANQPAQRAS